MALIKCPKCGKEFSDRAQTCPQCGTSKEEVQRLIKDQQEREAAERERIRKEREAKEARIRAEKRAAWWKKYKKLVIAITIILFVLLTSYVIYINVTPITAKNGAELRSALNNPFRLSKDSIKVIIPSGVTEIERYAFNDCTGLTSIEIPNSVACIGQGAFSGCTGLTSIKIPISVTRIENYAFYKCSGLTSITIPKSVTSIGYTVFYGCTKLTLKIPEKLREKVSVFDCKKVLYYY